VTLWADIPPGMGEVGQQVRQRKESGVLEVLETRWAASGDRGRERHRWCSNWSARGARESSKPGPTLRRGSSRRSTVAWRGCESAMKRRRSIAGGGGRDELEAHLRDGEADVGRRIAGLRIAVADAGKEPENAHCGSLRARPRGSGTEV
jgi:hypothetical protein